MKQFDPILADLKNRKETFWTQKAPATPIKSVHHSLVEELYEAEKRLQRFAPFIYECFHEVDSGIIESPLVEINHMKKWIEHTYETAIDGILLLKRDDSLPIAGSIKARGGIYEILKIAETLAVREGDLKLNDDYRILKNEKWRSFFSQYTITVGSTGNLGLSIGILSRKLGFQVYVHMSSDAKEWKKALLRKYGVHVIEHESDYSYAVAQGRKECERNQNCYFIDDEKSKDLFLGYAVAALRLKRQLKERNIQVNEQHPLFVYLPCGVGGAPGGITFGLKHVFGEHVHCIFAEPINAPCMFLSLVTGKGDHVSIQDIGLTLDTEADGLAVGRASSFVYKTIGQYIDGIYTVKDERLFHLLYGLYKTEGIPLEPSALAGMYGPVVMKNSSICKQYDRYTLTHSTHIVWATGGGLVPNKIMAEYIQKGKKSSE